MYVTLYLTNHHFSPLFSRNLKIKILILDTIARQSESREILESRDLAIFSLNPKQGFATHVSQSEETRCWLRKKGC